MNHKLPWPLTICVVIYVFTRETLTADPSPDLPAKYITVRFLRATNETEPSSAEVHYLDTIPQRTITDPAVWDLPSIRRLIYLLHKTSIYHEIFRRSDKEATVDENTIIHIINPLESRMPGSDISIKMIKEALEKIAKEFASMPPDTSTKHPLNRFQNVTTTTPRTRTKRSEE